MPALRSAASLLVVALIALSTAACSTAPAVAEEEAIPPEETNTFDFEEPPGSEAVPTQPSNLDADIENELLREGIEGDEVD